MNDPAITPHESDMSVTIMANSYRAIKYEITIKTPLRKRIMASEFSFDISGLMCPLYISIATDDDETSTSDDRVDIDAERTSNSIIAMSHSGRCAVSSPGTILSNAGIPFTHGTAS